MTTHKATLASVKKSRRGRIVVPVGQPRPAMPTKLAVAAKPSSRKRPSALDAAAEILGRLTTKGAATGLGVQDLIERMEKAGLWESPGGKTPSATLYSALIRDIAKRKADSRFKRVAPGKFGLAASRAKHKQRMTVELGKGGGR